DRKLAAGLQRISATQLAGPTNAERIRGRLATNPNRSKSRIFKPRNGPIIGEVSKPARINQSIGTDNVESAIQFDAGEVPQSYYSGRISTKVFFRFWIRRLDDFIKWKQSLLSESAPRNVAT